MKRACRVFFAYAMMLIFCVFAWEAFAEENKLMNLKLESPDFVHMGEIPKHCTCDGDDKAPALRWSDLPAGTQSLALIVDDPDAPDPAAPKLVWVHWVLYNIPPSSGGLAAAAEKLPAGSLRGLNDWKRADYGGPCPPIGRHRYFFKLYALDAVLPDLDMPDKSQLEKAMAGHVIGHTELVGTYKH